MYCEKCGDLIEIKIKFKGQFLCNKCVKKENNENDEEKEK